MKWLNLSTYLRASFQRGCQINQCPREVSSSVARETSERREEAERRITIYSGDFDGFKFNYYASAL